MPKPGAPTDLRIRPAGRDDMPALGVLGALLMRFHHGLDPDRFIGTAPGTARSYGAYLAGEFERPDVVVLVADIAGTVAGYTYSGLEGQDYMALRGPAGVVYDLVVDPARRREGVGRTLLDATLAELAARGAPRIVLSTAERNESAQRLSPPSAFAER